MAKLLNENQIDFATDEEMAKAIATLLEMASQDQLEKAFEKLDMTDLDSVASISERVLQGKL